jgi:two-component system phosphate regulon sensor histidine kinase PhoR
MNRFRWFYHPVFIFVFSIVALATSLFLYIYWYMEVSTGLQAVVAKHQLDPDQFLEAQTWVVILVLSILVGIILTGVLLIFIYNQRAWQLYRTQRNFINSFTHELKTPVTSLRLYLDTFAKYELSREDQIKYIEYMIQDVDRLLNNITRIMNLAKLESRSYRNEFMESDLVQTVQRFCETNSGLFRNCEISVHNPAGTPFPYRINPTLFDIFLMNILTNAVKYNASGAPRIDIRFLPEKKRLKVQFADNGIGIERSEVKKIFRKFYRPGRVDDLTARGTGLGLYMVQQIAKIHNGDVSAHSEGAGKGSMITLTLPLRLQPAE